MKYNRIILKLSGETLAPEERPTNKKVSATFQEERIMTAAKMITQLHDKGIQLGIILGGGNIWRGRSANSEMDDVTADQMGMLATIINALAVQEAIRRLGYKATVYTAQEMNRFAELYRVDKVLQSMENGEIVLLAGGTGNPFFTTDTGAALRAAELKADVLFKGTTTDGVYTADPNDEKTKDIAEFIPELTYKEAIEKKLGVMDLSAYLLCDTKGVKSIRVFNMSKLENILRAADGEDIGSVIHP